MRRILLLVLILLTAASMLGAAPHFLLTPQRLRRIKRDRDRQTTRWANFERRLQQAPDSPERGFELALYYAITADEARGREAIAWSKAHPCEQRQIAIIADWVGEDTLKSIQTVTCKPQGGRIAQLRDQYLKTGTLDSAAQSEVVQALRDGAYRDSRELYAASELLAGNRMESDKFFDNLPQLFLLSLPPDAVEHPDWFTHIAALALVGLQPNGTGSQFLQGWAIEDRHMLNDGPGVAYELLWADPYLPGVGYQNMDPWLMDEDTGTLLARSDWTPAACWLQISHAGQQSKNCPPGWDRAEARFGHLRLLPMSERCLDVNVRPPEAAVLWKLPASQPLRYREANGKNQISPATSSGLWRVPLDVSGRVCLAR